MSATGWVLQTAIVALSVAGISYTVGGAIAPMLGFTPLSSMLIVGIVLFAGLFMVASE